MELESYNPPGDQDTNEIYDSIEYLTPTSIARSDTENVHSQNRKWMKVLTLFIIGLVISVAGPIAVWLSNMVKLANETGTSQQTCSFSHPSVPGHWISGGHRSNETFNTVISKVKDTNQTKHMYQFHNATLRMSVISDQLWVSVRETNIIEVLSTTTVNKIKQITTSKYAKHPYSLRSDNNSHVLLCSETGLDVLSLDGSHLYKVHGGFINDLHVDCNVAYVYNRGKNSIVTNVYNKGVWVGNNTFKASNSNRNYWNTLLVIEETVYVCSSKTHTIHTYTRTGRYITQYGGWGKKKPGHIFYPFLCGVDSQNLVLVCDHSNNRLQVLSANGTWKVFKLPGIWHPFDLITDIEGNLWVLHRYSTNYNITKFSV